MRKIMLSMIMVMIAGITFAQAQWNYISPIPDAKYATVEHNITLRCSEMLDVNIINAGLFRVEGTSSGLHTGTVTLAADSRTLIFSPDRKFDYNETVNVTFLGNVNSLDGNPIPALSFSFRTIKENNDYLKEVYARKVQESYGSFNTETNQTSPVPEFKSAKNDNLPADFPDVYVAVSNDPSPGYAFITPNNPFGPATQVGFNMMLDKFGTPVYYKKNIGASADLKIQQNGQISNFIPSQAGGLGIVFGSNVVYNSYMSVVDTFQMANGYLSEVHEFLLFENGHSVMITYDPQIVDMSAIVEGGDPAATVMGFIMQELDADKNLVFEWSSWDHIAITDAVADIDLTAVFIDYCHGNAVELDNDGNYLVSFRHLDEIIKVNRETGDIMWRWNSYKPELNDITFLNDTIKFSHQHDVRRLDNGHITIFDNGNLHWGPYSRVVEYVLDEENMTAELVWSWPGEPGHSDFAFAMGSAQRLPDQNTFIGWGIGWVPMNIASEVTPDHGTTYEVWGPDTTRSYRAYKFNWQTDLFSTSKDTVNYGQYTGYTPIPYIIQITNNSAEPIVISGTFNNSPVFTIASALPLNIPAGATQNLIVNFFPQNNIGQFEDVLTIYCDLDADSKIARQVVLKGYTVDATTPIVAFSPADGTIDVSRKPEILITANEKLFNANGEELTLADLADMLVFKTNDANGEDVPFLAKIKWYASSKTEISIMPLDSLLGEQNYYVSLKANMTQDWAGNVVANDKSIVFTTVTSAGIFDRNIVQLEAYPNPALESVRVNFELQGLKQINLMDLSGRSLNQFTTSQISTEIDLNGLPSGVYFVRVYFENGQYGSSKIIKK